MPVGLPRGWTFSVDGTGVAATITVPAIAGVAHVLDAIEAQLVTTGAFASWPVLLSSASGTFTNLILGRTTVPVAAAASAEASEISRSGLALAAAQGEALTVAFQGSGATLTETLVIHGYDI